MISKELFNKIFIECAKNNSISISNTDCSNNYLKIDTGYNTFLSGIFIKLNQDSFDVSLSVTDNMPFHARVWEFISEDIEYINSRFVTVPKHIFEMDEHRIRNTLSTSFPIAKHTAEDYKESILAALPDIATYIDIYRQYIRDIPELMLNVDIKIARTQLITEIELREKASPTHYLFNDMNASERYFTNDTLSYDARNIFIRLGEQFGWNMKLANNIAFNTHETLLLPNATQEDYAIWFIYDSNFIKTKSTKNKTKIYGNGKIIEEPALFEKNMKAEQEKRIVFALKSLEDGNSVFKFLGIFRAIRCEQVELYDKKVYVNIYAMVSNFYENKTT